MTSYQAYGINLTKGQLEKLKRAYESNSAITIRLDKNQTSGNHELMLTKTQINKIKKAKSNGTGVDIKISKTQIRKAIKEGGNLFTSLINLGTKMLPYATKAVTKVAPALATGAAQALGSLGIDKIFGKGIDIPFKFLTQLKPLSNELTKKQMELINTAYQSGRGISFKPTQKQIQGGFLGTLAAIGIPMAIELASKLFGKGLNVSQKPTLMPYLPPPFLGTWENPVGMGVKKKKIQKKKMTVVGKKQSISGSNFLKPKFKDIPLSNIDLLEWINYLEIPNFKGIFSRDAENHFHDTGSCIINLDDKIGPGTHWVATWIKPRSKIIYYFDSFSLPPPKEFVDYAKRLKMRYKFNYGNPIQKLESVRCGYYCLYFLNENNKGKSYYDLLKVFSLSDKDYNEKFIKKYFS